MYCGRAAGIGYPAGVWGVRIQMMLFSISRAISLICLLLFL